MAKNKRENYRHPATMKFIMDFAVAEKMYKLLKAKPNMSSYLRRLIMQAENCDELGNILT